MIRIISGAERRLKAFQAVEKLNVHNILEEDTKNIQPLGYPYILFSSDKTVLYLATKLDAVILGSDRTVRPSLKADTVT